MKALNWSRSVRSTVVIVAAIVAFVSFNVFIATGLPAWRLDLTSEGLYTLSGGARQVLGEIDEPVTLRFYQSEELRQLGPTFAGHLDRVEAMVDEFEQIAAGRLVVERYAPQPYSPEEDLAVADGMLGVPIGGDRQIYFGIAGSNSTDDRNTIPYLAPERADFLEYDLARLIADLANPDKQVIGVIGDAPLRGTQADGFQPWVITGEMGDGFSLRYFSGDIEAVADDVDLLLLAQPSSLSETTLYAIDQFALRGGRIIAFLDPLFEPVEPGSPLGTTDFATLGPLLERWGVSIDPDTLIADMDGATRVQTMDRNRPVQLDYPLWIQLTTSNFDMGDAALGGLETIVVKSPGEVTQAEGATTELAPLITSSTNAMRLAAEPVRMMPDPIGIANSFAADGGSHVIAARVSGEVTGLFPDGPPEQITDEAVRAAHLSASEAPLSLIVVADADILADGSWLQGQNFMGQRITVPFANNGDFVLNALENLSGAEGLMGLRGRGIIQRRFTRLDDMRQAAEARYQETEQQLLGRIDEAQSQITEMQRRENDGGILMTAEQQAAIDDLRDDVLELRGELRGVRYSLQVDVDSLANTVRLANLLAMPALVVLIAILMAWSRRRRAARSAHLG